MKNCLILANCFADEYRRHLSSLKEFSDSYRINIITTYADKPDDRYFDYLSNSDLVISQDVKSIYEYSSEFILKNKKDSAIYFKTGFWRFNGYWPVSSSNERKNNWFWFPPDEFLGVDNFHDYMNYPIKADLILSNFEAELVKFKLINGGLDVDVYDYFINNQQATRLFSDSWHPTADVIRFACQNIVNKIGIDEVVPSFPSNLINSNRYRLIVNSVKDVLGLSFSENGLWFFNKFISEEAYFYFARHIQSKVGLNTLNSMADVQFHFDDFMGHY